MDKETMSLLMTKLEVVASKIGVGAEYLFSIYVKQAYIEALKAAILIPAIIVTAFLCNWFWKKLEAMGKDAWDMPHTHNLGAIITGIGVFVMGIVFFADTLPTIFECLLNPEYYALSKLLSQIR